MGSPKHRKEKRAELEKQLRKEEAEAAQQRKEEESVLGEDFWPLSCIPDLLLFP